MKTLEIIIDVFQRYIIPIAAFITALCLAPQLQPAERVAFSSLMAQVLASMLIALALLPHFRGTPAIHWSSLLIIGIGEATAIGGAVPTWFDHIWQLTFAITIAAATVALFAVVASIGPANDQRQKDENLYDIIQKAHRLDPDPP